MQVANSITHCTQSESYERNEPFSFQLGIGQVIRGWDKGLVDICEGEKRKLVIPPHLAYGDVSIADQNKQLAER